MFVPLHRAYRIGQRKDVTVLRLISLGSVEEIIYLRQVYKQVPDNYDDSMIFHTVPNVAFFYCNTCKMVTDGAVGNIIY